MILARWDGRAHALINIPIDSQASRKKATSKLSWPFIKFLPERGADGSGNKMNFGDV